MDMTIVCLRQRLYVKTLAGLMFCNIMTKMQHDRFVEVLDLAVGLRVICISGQMLNAQGDCD